MKRKAILSISSQVVRGHVGNSAAGFALRRLGLEVYEVPTLVWNHHPGHGAPKGLVVAPDQLAGLLERFERPPWGLEIAMIVTGYMRDADQARVAADAIARIKSLNPSVSYVCDPVCGDAGGSYVAAAVIEALREGLVPLADAITPNRHELALIAGRDVGSNAAILDAAASLGTATALVSSAHASRAGCIANLVVERTVGAQILETPLLAKAPNGTGDLLTALFAGWLALGRRTNEAAATAVAAVHDVILATAETGADELALIEAQALLVSPSTIPLVSTLSAARLR